MHFVNTYAVGMNVHNYRPRISTSFLKESIIRQDITAILRHFYLTVWHFWLEMSINIRNKSVFSRRCPECTALIVYFFSSTAILHNLRKFLCEICCCSDAFLAEIKPALHSQQSPEILSGFGYCPNSSTCLLFTMTVFNYPNR